MLLLTATGCDTMHRKTVSAAPPPEAPELSQTPLYSPEMSENTPRLPTLPAPTNTAQVQPPPPPEKKPHRPKKTTKPAQLTVAKSTGSTPPDTAAAPATTPPAATTEPAPVQVAEHKPATPASAADVPAASPIGELTAGSSEDAAQTNHQTEDLIKNTRNGLSNIKRALSPDEKKTATEIQSFLDRAQQALKNGDGDGAFGLATKAKLLLDELTQQ
jgi:hypothetical protein